MANTDDIAARLSKVREQIAAAAERAGRSPESVRLIAVTKTFPAETVRAAYACGLRDFGENRVQEFQDKQAHLQLPDAHFHLIGHLQSNKAAAATGFQWIHTLDSERLARRLHDAAAEAGKQISVLIQVKLEEAADAQTPDADARHVPAEESGRSGIAEPEVQRVAAFVAGLPHLQLRGLMTLPPLTEDPEGARPFFRRLHMLRDRLRKDGFSQIEELSMGMTHDFPIAIEEGATMVRIGTALFGARPPQVRDNAK